MAVFIEFRFPSKRPVMQKVFPCHDVYMMRLTVPGCRQTLLCVLRSWEEPISETWNMRSHVMSCIGTNTKKARDSGGRFNIKMSYYQYRKSHCGDKMVVRSSCLHNGISYTGKMTSLYWIRALEAISVAGTPLPTWFNFNPSMDLLWEYRIQHGANGPDPFMSHLATQLGYSAGEFQAL